MSADTPLRSRGRPIEVAPRMPDPALPQADWADAFELLSDRRTESMKALATRIALAFPPWGRRLARLRNAIVGPLGLKTSGDQSASTMIGPFPIVTEEEERLVVGFDDRHLDFRIVLERETIAAGQISRVTTLVRRRNRFGRLYLAAIAPIHKALVPSMLERSHR